MITVPGMGPPNITIHGWVGVVEPLRLYGPRRPVVILLASMVTGTACFAALALLTPVPTYVVAAGIAAGLTALISGLLVLKLLRPRPYLEIDATGITSAHARASITWSEVDRIRVNGGLVEVVSRSSAVIRIFTSDLPESFLAYATAMNPDITVTTQRSAA